jgi:hypothetical protein
MDPITAINQEFARTVVKDWSDTTDCRHSAHAIESSYGIGTVLRAFAAWVRGSLRQSRGAPEVVELAKITK